MQALLQQAAQLLEDKQAALTAGDWAAYGEADSQLAETIQQLLALTEGE
jgi:hypothetical protein